jgi:hypothetical protein
MIPVLIARWRWLVRSMPAGFGLQRRLSAAASICAVSCLFATPATAWGPEGHSIVGEIAQRRLTPAASAAVTTILGRGVSLASVSMWADDVRGSRPETYNWHFVNIPVADTTYDAALHCAPTPKGDCVVAELERLRNELRCAPTGDGKRDALRFAVHFVADTHQPLHTVREEQGGNRVLVAAYIGGATCTGRCNPTPMATNLHAVWDSTILQKAAWDWGALVEVVEKNLPRYLQGASTSSEPKDWAIETHGVAQAVWAATPKNGVVDEEYYRMALPIALQQVGRAGVRLAAFLNDAYAATACPVR